MPHAPANPNFPLELSVWLSPAFPVGSFAYSHGLEWAVEAERINDRETAQAWLMDLLDAGGPRTDAILIAATWRAAIADDVASLGAINDLALALAGSRERYLETTTQGNAFMTMALAAWNADILARARAALSGDIAYPVSIGITAAAHAIALSPTLNAYLMMIATNLVSALVRLSAIGQTDGQRVIAALTPSVAATAAAAAIATLEDIGSAAFLSDIAAMAHETQYTRLFRS